MEDLDAKCPKCSSDIFDILDMDLYILNKKMYLNCVCEECGNSFDIDVELVITDIK